MKTLALVLFAMFCTVSCKAQSTEPVGEVIEDGVEENGAGLEAVHLKASVEGTRFSFDSPIPVVPGRGAKVRKFPISASFSGTEVGSFVLHSFKTLKFKPGLGGGDLGRWQKEPDEYHVYVDGTKVEKIVFRPNEKPKMVELRHEKPGAHPHLMLGLTVTLRDANDATIAEFVDPWDIQP